MAFVSSNQYYNKANEAKLVTYKVIYLVNYLFRLSVEHGVFLGGWPSCTESSVYNYLYYDFSILLCYSKVKVKKHSRVRKQLAFYYNH